MRNFILFIGIASLTLLLSCQGNNATKKAYEDSIRKADSLINVEAIRQAEEAALAAAEQTQHDSIRQDSISRIEKLNKFNLKHFITKWEDGSYLKDFKEIKSFLTKEGF